MDLLNAHGADIWRECKLVSFPFSFFFCIAPRHNRCYATYYYATGRQLDQTQLRGHGPVLSFNHFNNFKHFNIPIDNVRSSKSKTTRKQSSPYQTPGIPFAWINYNKI